MGAWTWVTSNPTPYSGSQAHQSVKTDGVHQHYFANASATMAVQAGDRLFTYVYLDPNNVPREVMLQWNLGGGRHWRRQLLSSGGSHDLVVGDVDGDDFVPTTACTSACIVLIGLRQ